MDWPGLLKDELSLLLREDPGNRDEDGDFYFQDPLMGFASADDPLFGDYKKVIGDFYPTPGEWFEKSFGKGSWAGGTVINWILPITREIRRSNRSEKKLPSRKWAHTRNFGERFNNRVREGLSAMLEARGCRTVAPMIMEDWRDFEAPLVGLASNWSERHAAYAAGLGTFSLNNGLITRRGIAHRCGSLITELIIEPTRRSYEHPYEFCLYHRDGSCGDCIGRCPAGAVSREGHDKERCRRYLREAVLAEVGPSFGVETAGCGLCQTGVPCEEEIPGGESEQRLAAGRRE